MFAIDDNDDNENCGDRKVSVYFAVRFRVGFRGAGARAPGLPPTGGLPPNP